MSRRLHVEAQPIEASNPPLVLIRLVDQEDTHLGADVGAEFFATHDDLRAIIRACQGVLHTPEPK